MKQTAENLLRKVLTADYAIYDRILSRKLRTCYISPENAGWKNTFTAQWADAGDRKTSPKIKAFRISAGQGNQTHDHPEPRILSQVQMVADEGLGMLRTPNPSSATE